MLSLSWDQVSARLCLPPGMWAGHTPRRGGGRELGEDRQSSVFPPPINPALLAHLSLTQCSGTAAMSVRDCPSHNLPGRTGNSAPLGAFPEQHKPDCQIHLKICSRTFGVLHALLSPRAPLLLHSTYTPVQSDRPISKLRQCRAPKRWALLCLPQQEPHTGWAPE